MPKSDSGFNEEQFRKLVAMFDSPYRNEAIVAFNKALDELAKDQKRFCDRLVDSTEAKIAKVECKRIRTELAGAFEKLAKREAEAKQLEETISVLQQRIAMMEEVHRDSDVRSAEQDADFEAVPDYDWTAERYTQTAQAQDQAWAAPENLGFEARATARHEPESVVFNQGSPLPFGVAFYWLFLLSLVLIYMLWSLILWRPLTDADWQNLAPKLFLLVPAATAALYFLGRRRRFAATRLGRVCSECLGSREAMLTGLFLLLSIYVVAILGALYSDGKASQYQHAGILGLGLAFALIVYVVTREIVNFGVKGLFLHACMVIDVMAAAFVLLSQRAPWHFMQIPYPPPLVHPGLVAIATGVLLYWGTSERVTWWFLEDDDEYMGEDEHGRPTKRKSKRSDWINFPAVMILIVTIFGPHNDAEAHGLPHTAAPHHSAKPSRSIDNRETPQLLLAQEDASVAPPEHVDQPAEWKVWCVVIGGSLVGLRVLAWRLHRARLCQARRQANTFTPANVHGAAGYASSKQARKGGWV